MYAAEALGSLTLHLIAGYQIARLCQFWNLKEAEKVLPFVQYGLLEPSNL